MFVKINTLLASHITQTVENVHAALKLMHLHLLNYDMRLIPLACVDDVLAISNCGFDAIKVNTAINTIIELKKLEFHIPNQENKKKSKCHSLHVGKPSQFCPGMKVHGHSAERVNEALYLGDIIRTDGKNLSNIMDRVNKG